MPEYSIVKVPQRPMSKPEEISIIKRFIEVLPGFSYLAGILDEVAAECEEQIRNDHIMPIVKDLREARNELQCVRERLMKADEEVIELSLQCVRERLMKADEEVIELSKNNGLLHSENDELERQLAESKIEKVRQRERADGNKDRADRLHETNRKNGQCFDDLLVKHEDLVEETRALCWMVLQGQLTPVTEEARNQIVVVADIVQPS